MNNLVYFRGILAGSVIVTVSWAIENNLAYLRTILAGSMIIIVYCAIENNFYLRPIMVGL